MYLHVQNQLTLLHDLLEEQSIYKSGTESEYRQIRKLIQTMMANKETDEALLAVLPKIYYYVIKGEVAHAPDDHIQENEANIQTWLHTIQETKQQV